MLLSPLLELRNLCSDSKCSETAYRVQEMRIHLLDEVYPMGDEVVLIYEATGRVAETWRTSY